jgi:hypothetical protein
MATIKTIIDELNTIATAFSSVNSFIFDEIGEINDDISKTYPALLINSRDVNFTNENFNDVYLPRKKTITLQMFLFDTYKESEQVTTDRQTKYANLLTIGDQFLAEVKRRSMEEHLGFEILTGSNGFEVDKLHNDNLVQVFFNLTFTAKQDCTVGTFNYA